MVKGKKHFFRNFERKRENIYIENSKRGTELGTEEIYGYFTY